MSASLVWVLLIAAAAGWWLLTKVRRSREAGSLMQATFNGIVIAESDRTIVIEGNHYFPADAIRSEYFTGSSTHTTCPWKGVASYYTVEVDGSRNQDAAWYYPTPSRAAQNIAGHVAFWNGVKVRKAPVSHNQPPLKEITDEDAGHVQRRAHRRERPDGHG